MAPSSKLQSLRFSSSRLALLKNDWVMTVSRPRMSRTTTRASPAPVSAGKLSMLKGPEGTFDVCRSASLTYSSTVLGAADSPVTVGMGWVTKPGCKEKFLANCTPPK
jgi:hypothetical protein